MSRRSAYAFVNKASREFDYYNRNKGFRTPEVLDTLLALLRHEADSSLQALNCDEVSIHMRYSAHTFTFTLLPISWPPPLRQ